MSEVTLRWARFGRADAAVYAARDAAALTGRDVAAAAGFAARRVRGRRAAGLALFSAVTGDSVT